MSIFKIDNKRVQQLSLKQSGFGNEFALRDFFAENDNLYNILGIKFLAKEYQIPNGRIDTIGIDENGSPVIIEYKWKENDDVLSQGCTSPRSSDSHLDDCLHCSGGVQLCKLPWRHLQCRVDALGIVVADLPVHFSDQLAV
jgi:hypothetical protein